MLYASVVGPSPSPRPRSLRRLLSLLLSTQKPLPANPPAPNHTQPPLGACPLAFLRTTRPPKHSSLQAAGQTGSCPPSPPPSRPPTAHPPSLPPVLAPLLPTPPRRPFQRARGRSKGGCRLDRLVLSDPVIRVRAQLLPRKRHREGESEGGRKDKTGGKRLVNPTHRKV